MIKLIKIRLFAIFFSGIVLLSGCQLVPQALASPFFVKAISIIGEGIAGWIVFETVEYVIDAAYSAIFGAAADKTEDAVQSEIRPISDKQPLLGRKIGDHKYFVQAAGDNNNNTITISTAKILFKRDDVYSKWYLTSESRELIKERLKVATAQHALITMKYPTGSMDGIWKEGGKTEKAIKMFQKDNGLSQTGRLNDETMELLLTIK